MKQIALFALLISSSFALGSLSQACLLSSGCHSAVQEAIHCHNDSSCLDSSEVSNSENIGHQTFYQGNVSPLDVCSCDLQTNLGVFEHENLNLQWLPVRQEVDWENHSIVEAETDGLFSAHSYRQVKLPHNFERVPIYITISSFLV